jgi:hypothetical protein
VAAADKEACATPQASPSPSAAYVSKHIGLTRGEPSAAVTVLLALLKKGEGAA